MEQQVRLETPNSMGTTRRQTLESGRKQMAAFKTKQQLDELFKELEPIKPVRGTEYMLGYFSQLSTRRQVGMSGPAAITFQEIEAFNRLNDLNITPWEVQTLCKMDTAYLHESYKLQDNKPE